VRAEVGEIEFGEIDSVEEDGARRGVIESLNELFNKERESGGRGERERGGDGEKVSP